jgi:hypothetical protein
MDLEHTNGGGLEIIIDLKRIRAPPGDEASL